jgi:hypothetical protein
MDNHLQFINTLFEDFMFSDEVDLLSPEAEEEIQEKSMTNLFKIPNYLEKVILVR